ncbi:hypothetical protein EYF80_026848 [Liparis tanakae]|uniref:Uncharacterized protein n=1 Tax=Liparis tanakae TaxID=230148 RepID=A0A4Z2HAV7_9TELE|nr:hypothetical protein EYF80_026848 [Liparis tanakae]
MKAMGGVGPWFPSGVLRVNLLNPRAAQSFQFQQRLPSICPALSRAGSNASHYYRYYAGIFASEWRRVNSKDAYGQG